MDVVRKQIQKLRGRIDLNSVPGQGTTFLLRLPLTLAIVDGLVVAVGDQRYIVPLSAVKEVLRSTNEMLYTVQGRGEMAMVRDTLLPIVRLWRRFNVRPRSEELSDGILIVLEGGGKTFSLAVDELLGKQEVVIKSLGEMMPTVPGVAGGAILGDGRVGLILDPDALVGKTVHD
jgi:two-component system chemotaxis sensor kinase CheA